MNTLQKLFAILLTTLLLTSCVVVINQNAASPEETAMYTMQKSVNQELNQVNQKIKGGNYDADSLQKIVEEAENVVDNSLKQLSELKITEKAQKMATDTKHSLESAKRNFDQLLVLAKDLQDLKKQSVNASQKTKDQIDAQIKNIQGTINEVSNQLGRIFVGIDNLGKQLEKSYKQLNTQFQSK